MPAADSAAYKNLAQPNAQRHPEVRAKASLEG
jgi:hypothetical protein